MIYCEARLCGVPFQAEQFALPDDVCAFDPEEVSFLEDVLCVSGRGSMDGSYRHQDVRPTQPTAPVASSSMPFVAAHPFQRHSLQEDVSNFSRSLERPRLASISARGTCTTSTSTNALLALPTAPTASVPRVPSSSSCLAPSQQAASWPQRCRLAASPRSVAGCQLASSFGATRKTGARSLAAPMNNMPWPWSRSQPLMPPTPTPAPRPLQDAGNLSFPADAGLPRGLAMMVPNVDDLRLDEQLLAEIEATPWPTFLSSIPGFNAVTADSSSTTSAISSGHHHHHHQGCNKAGGTGAVGVSTGAGASTIAGASMTPVDAVLELLAGTGSDLDFAILDYQEGQHHNWQLLRQQPQGGDAAAMAPGLPALPVATPAASGNDGVHIAVSGQHSPEVGHRDSNNPNIGMLKDIDMEPCLGGAFANGPPLLSAAMICLAPTHPQPQPQPQPHVAAIAHLSTCMLHQTAGPGHCTGPVPAPVPAMPVDADPVPQPQPANVAAAPPTVSFTDYGALSNAQPAEPQTSYPAPPAPLPSCSSEELQSPAQPRAGAPGPLAELVPPVRLPPVRLPSAGHNGAATGATGAMRATGGGRGRSGPTLESLRELFDLPSSDVVRALGISATDLKRRCRALGIRRWPQRKLISLRRLAEAVEEDKEISADERHSMLERVAQNRAKILEDPDAELDPSLKVLRQMHYKRHFMERQNTGSA